MTLVSYAHKPGRRVQQCEFPKKCSLPSSRIQLVVGMVQCILLWGWTASLSPVSCLNRNQLTKLLLYFDEVFHV